jgi:Flp pilus assembly pilin Flp
MRFQVKSLFRRFAQDERGATLVEYGIAVVLAVVVGTTGLITLAGQVDSNMDQSTAAMCNDAAITCN